MFHRAFWTERRFTGLLLLLGLLLYVAAVASMPRDVNGTLLVLVSDDRSALLVVAAQPTLTRVCLGLFISGSIVTPLGLAMLTRLLWDAGDRTWSYLGLLTELMGSVFWIIYLSVALGLFPLAGQDTAKTGVIPSYLAGVGALFAPLYVIFSILVCVTLLAYGTALLRTRVLPHWVGWITIPYALVTLPGAPIAHYFLPAVYGFLLLLPRRAPLKREQREAAPRAPTPLAVRGGGD
jgi:hypothetical protein